MASAQEHYHEVLRENEELKARILELEAELEKKKAPVKPEEFVWPPIQTR